MAKYEIRWNGKAQLSRLEGGVGRTIRTLAFEIERRAKLKIQAEPLVDTGSMVNSVHVKLYGRDGRPEAMAKAAAKRPGIGNSPRRKKPALVTEPASFASPAPSPKNEMGAVVAAAVDYATYHEFGAPAAGLPPRPFLRPAVDESVGRLGSIAKKEMR